MNRKTSANLKSFTLEALLYGGFVAGYFCLVLRYLGGWLLHLFRQERTLYAFIALVLIIGQGMVLEFATRLLIRLGQRRIDGE